MESAAMSAESNVIPIRNACGLPVGAVAEYIAEALAGAERVIESEMNDRVTYVNGSTVRRMKPEDVALRTMILARDELDGWIQSLHDRKKGYPRFGRLSVPFNPETGGPW
jgi:hypothetical protein